MDSKGGSLSNLPTLLPAHCPMHKGSEGKQVCDSWPHHPFWDNKKEGAGEGEELVKRSWRENCPAESTALARGVGRAPSQATPSVGTPGMLNYVPCRWGSGRTDSVLEKLKQADMDSGLFLAWRLGEEVMARWRQGPGNGAVLERLSGQVMCECPRAGHVGQRAGLGSTWASP